MNRPRIGVLLLASGWMRDVGLDRDGGGLAKMVQDSSRRILARLGELCDAVYTGVAASGPEAARAAEHIAQSGCDAVLVAPMVWVEDQVMRAGLEKLGDLPLILATLLPHDHLPSPAPFARMLASSGTVGALQASGMLRRVGRDYTAVAGAVDDPGTYREIWTRGRAAAAATSLRGARLGVLPGRSESMSVTWVDEVGLRTRVGVELVPLEIGRVARCAQAATAADLHDLRARVADAGMVTRCDPDSLEQGMRVAASIAQVAREERLLGLAMDDLSPEMHHVLGLRPCLPHPALCADGFAVSMEADVAALVLMLALQRFTGRTPFYTEIFTADTRRNGLLMGHAGWHSPELGDPAIGVQLVPDAEYQTVDRHPGAAIWFALPPGEVTAVNAVWRDGGLRLSWIEGHSEGGSHLEGNCHLLCRLDEPPSEFLQRVTDRGVSQHWVVVAGRHGDDLRHLAARMGVPLDR